jgi:5'-phosphate synthase pdxT subunit
VTVRIGVLALQGGFAPHVRAVVAAGATAVAVRTAADARGLDGLVLPGGESTTMLELLGRERGLREALDAHVAAGRPVLATCAGLILAAREVRDPAQPSLGWLDVSVSRNAWGRQLSSFEAMDDDGVHPLVLIRAPRIVRVGPGVEVLARFRGEPLLVRAGAITGATFHPELAGSLDVHRRALGLIEETRASRAPS